MIELGITGAKNAGKTTLVCEMVRLLTADGYTVATIKHTGHPHTFDSEGKDSHLHRQAGAPLTVAVSTAEVAVFARPSTGVYEAVWSVIRTEFDWCLIEGDRGNERPKVFLTRNSEADTHTTLTNIVATYGGRAISEDIPHFCTGDVAGLIAFLKTTMNSIRTGSVANV